LLSRITKSINRLFNNEAENADTEPAEDPKAEDPKAEAPPPARSAGSAKSDDDSQPSRNRNRNRNRNRSRNRNRDRNPERQEAPRDERHATPEPAVDSSEDWTPPTNIPVQEGTMRFIDFDLPKPLLRGICELDFKYCTPIQQECLPPALEGRDITGKAQTGTGKTAAFLVASMNHILTNPKTDRRSGDVRALVLAPTRELAMQIHKDAEDLGKYCGLRNLVVFGGMDHRRQRDQLSEPVDILVGTPGRLIDYMQSRHLNLRHVEILIIDEADRMLDMGFIPDVRRIVNSTPRPGQRRTQLFSATFSSAILRLVENWQVDPVRLEVDPENIVADLIEEIFYSVSTDDKLSVLLWILRIEEVDRMLIFTNRKDEAAYLDGKLKQHGIASCLLSGDVAQKNRMRILEDFREGRTKVVVATDVAGRGIHVDNISHVINFDLPYEVESYVHRIGRTGRAGTAGKAISLACEYGAYIVPDLEEFIGRQIEFTQPPGEALELPEPVHAEPPPRTDEYARGNQGGSRGGGGGRGGRGGGQSRSRGGPPRGRSSQGRSRHRY
jgi:ATP-dependent RNA helicase RhlB